jgi:hypothetical protein
MAQHNYIKYKEDKNDKVISQASIEVDTEILKENDLITLPYAASRQGYVTGIGGDTECARVPQYTKTEGKIEFRVLEPRILTAFSYLHFNVDFPSDYSSYINLDASNLKKKYYEEYQQIMFRPVVITERFNLTEIDLRDIDFTKPIYLEQYGRYYAIITIEYQNGISKAELLQL